MSQATEPRNVDSWQDVPKNRHSEEDYYRKLIDTKNKELEPEGLWLLPYREVTPPLRWINAGAPSFYVSDCGQYATTPFATYKLTRVKHGKVGEIKSISAKPDEKDATDLQPPKPTGQTRRKEVLREVEKCVCRDRQATYSDAEDNFKDIATIASIVLSPKLLEPLSAADVAAFCAAIKLARLRTSPGHMDNWIDLAGYAVCGGGIVLAGRRGSTPNNEGGGD